LPSANRHRGCCPDAGFFIRFAGIGFSEALFSAVGRRAALVSDAPFFFPDGRAFGFLNRWVPRLTRGRTFSCLAKKK
jgi:hypothetical protein